MATLTPGQMPFDVIIGLNGHPLNGGRVYIGEPNKDPEAYPLPVFWDAGGTIPAAQPLETSGGYVVRAGTPARWWTTGAYSITVRDRQGRQVWHAAEVVLRLPDGSVTDTSLSNDPEDLAAILAKLQFLQDGAGAEYMSALAAMKAFAVRPEQYGAKGDGHTDDFAAFEKALSYLKAQGGGTLALGRKTYATSGCLEVWRGIKIVGESREASKIKKIGSGTTSVALTRHFNALGRPLGFANAVIFLNGPAKANYQTLWSFTIAGDTMDPNTTTVDYGIVSADGGLSDFDFYDLNVEYVKYPVVFGAAFVGRVALNRFHYCLHGPLIETGTSIAYHGNYASYTKYWGHYLRDIQYSLIFANACDNLNNRSRYTDTTVHAYAYRFNRLQGCAAFGNGAEALHAATFLEVDNCRQFQVFNNRAIGITSDYAGADDLALIEVKTAAYGVKICDNQHIFSNTNPFSGAANSAKHHNLRITAPSSLIRAGSKFEDNVFINAVNDNPEVEAGYGNSTPGRVVIRQGEAGMFTSAPAISAQTQGDLTVTYGDQNGVIAERVGSLLYVHGVLDIASITHSAASGRVTISNAVPIAALAGAGSQGLPVTSISGVVTEPQRNDLNVMVVAGATSATVDTADTSGTLSISEIPSGSTNVRIKYSGIIRVA